MLQKRSKGSPWLPTLKKCFILSESTDSTGHKTSSAGYWRNHQNVIDLRNSCKNCSSPVSSEKYFGHYIVVPRLGYEALERNRISLASTRENQLDQPISSLLHSAKKAVSLVLSKRIAMNWTGAGYGWISNQTSCQWRQSVPSWLQSFCCWYVAFKWHRTRTIQPPEHKVCVKFQHALDTTLEVTKNWTTHWSGTGSPKENVASENKLHHHVPGKHWVWALLPEI